MYQYQLRRESDGEIVAAGDHEVLQLLHNNTTSESNGEKTTRVWGIRDNYQFWADNGWEPWAGKPVWMTTPTSSKHHHVLFDDNIHNLPHDGIAGIRRQHQPLPPLPPSPPQLATDKTIDVVPSLPETSTVFESVSGSEVQKMHGLHLIRVPTVEPILNPEWFLQQLENVRQERIRRATGSIK